MSKAKWIWYPDDFEIELASKFMANRYERDIFIPPFWKQYSCYKNVKFIKKASLDFPETVKVRAEGNFNVQLDGVYVNCPGGNLSLGKGNTEIVVSVYNDKGVPCLHIDGKNVHTDGSWQVTCNDHKYLPAGTDDELIHGRSTPNNVKLATKELLPAEVFEKDGRTVYDFGREIFAYVKLTEAKTDGNPVVYYGESLCEVADTDNCELLSRDFKRTGNTLTTKIAKAFRYATAEGVTFEGLSALFEYLPLERKNSFTCNDPLINKIYEVAQYTLSLNTREVLIDGIKRDRWIWSGDAYQSYLMHYYSFFDKEVMKRTMRALFGKSPFDVYINHIMDYSFYWIMGLYDYYCYTGDKEFVGENLYKAFEIMDYALGRTDGEGFIDSRKDDWVFVDWADVDNSGVVCFEQILMVVALRNCAELGELFGEREKAEKYRKIFDGTIGKLDIFWNEEKHAYNYSLKEGKPDGKILRHPNMFAVLYDVCDDKRKQYIKENVLKNCDVPAITTPYMKFYEYAALCKAGERKCVIDEIRDYWGGMLSEGATTFWEVYDNREKGNEKYAMYGRKYGKSLCHAWGASPLYLIGKYVVGLTPTEGAESFELEPCLAGLKFFDAQLPLAKGFVKISLTESKVSVYSDELPGKLKIGGKTYDIVPKENKEVEYT